MILALGVTDRARSLGWVGAGRARLGAGRRAGDLGAKPNDGVADDGRPRVSGRVWQSAASSASQRGPDIAQPGSQPSGFSLACGEQYADVVMNAIRAAICDRVVASLKNSDVTYGNSFRRPGLPEVMNSLNSLVVRE